MFLSGPGLLTITGTFSDGTEQVLWQKMMNPAATLMQNSTMKTDLDLVIYDTSLFIGTESLTCSVGGESKETLIDGGTHYAFKLFGSELQGTQQVTIVRNSDSDENSLIFDGMMTF